MEIKQKVKNHKIISLPPRAAKARETIRAAFIAFAPLLLHFLRGPRLCQEEQQHAHLK
jgi:hypothetical protein